ncbi:hypothetical protein JHK82_030794 [Glycine max]|nr:hypothetical protein JHK85_031437 [Glycine max]KAG4994061.1 hypothetical protein JHK86_030888 [Glycine max]KAG5124057.1 hypothetical protein JHK82_030794 [Glycine max]KAG5145474.1 hypothetical protein JHK84_031017 [Glycine max]
MTTGAERYPDFFKLIPNAFVRLPQLQGRIPEDVILRNARHADFLVFKHDRSNEFKVVILESSTQCQKPVVKMEEENEQEQAAAQHVEDCDIEEEEDSSSKDENYDGSDSDDDEESEEEFSAGFKRQSHHRRACKRESASNSNPNAEDLLPEYDISINLLGDCHHNLAQQTFIKTKYQQVSGRVCRWKDYRIYIKGWDSFCRRNEIERDDTCFCEVISGEEQGVRTLRVHVARRR